MKPLLVIVGCVLTIACAAYLAPAGGEEVARDQQAAEPETAAQPPRALDAGLLKRRVTERARKLRQQEMLRIREALGVESEEQWARLEPPIGRLDQLRKGRRVFDRSPLAAVSRQRPGRPAQPDTDKAFAGAWLTMLCPDLEEEDWKELLEARAGLARAYLDPDSTEEAVSRALKAWWAAAAKWDERIGEARQEVLELTTPRQQAGLVLLGVL